MHKMQKPNSNKGDDFLVQRKYDEALQAYDKAIELDSKYAYP